MISNKLLEMDSAEVLAAGASAGLAAAGAEGPAPPCSAQHVDVANVASIAAANGQIKPAWRKFFFA
jgi:hypothetical protein